MKHNAYDTQPATHSHVCVREEVRNTVASPFETAYPNIAHWVKSSGWIQIGRDDYGDSFVQAFDEGGTVWEGSKTYKTLDEAFQALEKGLAEWMKEHE